MLWNSITENELEPVCSTCVGPCLQPWAVSRAFKGWPPSLQSTPVPGLLSPPWVPGQPGKQGSCWFWVDGAELLRQLW